MIEHKCDVDRGKGDREHKAQRAQHARQVGLQKTDIIVVVGLEALLKQEGGSQHDRAAVHHDRAAPFDQPRRDHVRPLGRAERGEGGKAVVADALGQIVRIEHAVDVERFQFAPQMVDQLAFTHAVQIAQTDHRVRAGSDAQESEFEPFVV